MVFYKWWCYIAYIFSCHNIRYFKLLYNKESFLFTKLTKVSYIKSLKLETIQYKIDVIRNLYCKLP